MGKNLRSRRVGHLQKTWPGWLFVSPFLIGFAVYYIWVLMDSLKFSFSKINVTPTGYSLTFLGWQNYYESLRVDPDFTRIMVNNIFTMFTTIPIILIFSLFIAVILNQKMPGRTLFRAIFFIPVVLSVGLIESADSGNAVLSTMGGLSPIETGAEMAAGGALSFADIQTLLQSLNFSPTLIELVTGAVNNIMTVINHSGVQIIIFLVGLQSISPSIYESAVMEGASGWESFWKITFPMISPMILVNLFFSIIDFFTRNNNSIMMHIKAKGYTGVASAMSWIYFLVIAVILVIIGLLIKWLMSAQAQEAKKERGR